MRSTCSRAAGGDVAAGHVGVLAHDRVAHGGDRDPVGGEPVGVDPDVDRALEAADDPHLADAGRRARAATLTILSASSVSSRSGRSAGERDREHGRRVVVELGDDRRVDVVGGRSRRTVATRSRTSWAATSMSRLEVEGRDDERAALARRSSAARSMPSTVLTASSMGCGDLGLDLLGRGAGEGGAHADGRQVDGGEAVDAELEVAGGADDDQRQDQHRRRRPAGGCRSRRASAWVAPAARQRVMRTVLAARQVAGLDRPRSRRRRARRGSRPAPSRRRPVRTRFSTALPSSTTSTFSMPAKVTIAEAGTNTHRLVGRRHDLGGRERARPQRAVALGTSASTISVRLLSSMAGLSRATFRRVGRRIAVDADADLLAERTFAARRARARRGAGAAGWIRTSVTTGWPAATYSPGVACRSCTAPSNGATSTESASCCRASSSSELPLGEEALPVEHLLVGLLGLALGDLERGLRGVESACGSSFCSKKACARSRRARASVSTAWAWRTTAVSAGSRARPPATREAQPGSGLRQGRLGLPDPQLEVGGREARQHLALGTRLPRSTVIARSRPATFMPSATSSSRGERAGDGDHVRHQGLGRGGGLDQARSLGRRPGRRLGLRTSAGRGQGRGERSSAESFPSERTHLLHYTGAGHAAPAPTQRRKHCFTTPGGT